MTALVRYETARAALADCRSVDEVKDIHDKAAAMTAYARMANDTQLEADASELRLRAERRLGVMIVAEKQTGRIKEGRPSGNCTDGEQFSRVKLDDVGIDRRLSARSQKVAGIGEQAMKRHARPPNDPRIQIRELRRDRRSLPHGLARVVPERRSPPPGLRNRDVLDLHLQDTGGTHMKSPLSNLPGWDAATRMSKADDFEDQLRKAFALQPRYTLRDSHAEQLAMDVVREQERVGP